MSERDWASLEGALLHEIFLRITADADAVHFRRVCRGWSFAAGAGAHVPRPWFLLRPAENDGAIWPTTQDDGGVHAFVRPAERRRRTRVRPVRVGAAVVTGGLPSASVRGASRGWLALAVNNGKGLLLRDPITRAEIPLPAFQDGYKLFDVFLSDDPLAAPGGGWTAFAFFRRDHVPDCPNYLLEPQVLAFWRPGDAEWARVDPDPAQVDQQIGIYYRGIEFFRGRPYVLLAVPAGLDPSSLAVCDVEARRLVVCSPNIRLPWLSEWGMQECVVECGGDLLLVQVAQRQRNDDDDSRWSLNCLVGRGSRISYVAETFRVRFGADGMPVAMERVASTGDYAVFVASRGHAFALPASGFPTVRAGCVYSFAMDYTGGVEGMVVIDLQAVPRRRDKFVRKLHLAGKWRMQSWFCPRPVLNTMLPAPSRVIDAWH